MARAKSGRMRRRADELRGETVINIYSMRHLVKRLDVVFREGIKSLKKGSSPFNKKRGGVNRPS